MMPSQEMAIETSNKTEIPLIDLFAGPGGLGEGFSQYRTNGGSAFRIGLSVEKDLYAHETLMLRSFFRNFEKKEVPEEYYQLLRGEMDLKQLFDKYPHEAEKAKNEAWMAELGKVDTLELDTRIRNVIKNNPFWVLIGGPPCQAYSTVGRSRNRGIENYVPEKDDRHFLYLEYLRIIAYHWPAVFIMENVRGILSAKVNSNLIFPNILKDLENPATVFNGNWEREKYRYRIFSLSKVADSFNSENQPRFKRIHDFTIKSEEYGVPQARHRVILMGIREDMLIENPPVLKKRQPVTVHEVLDDLPSLRSGFSKGEDSPERWTEWLKEICCEPWLELLSRDKSTREIYKAIISELDKLQPPFGDRGAEFICCKEENGKLSGWYTDTRIGGICNSSTRCHMAEDLHRYFFASCYTKAKRQSPILSEFPEGLLPQHKNARRDASRGNFNDRFRVQGALRPATTVMSHISKDGHYYIHYDPAQCRSLTVREAARLQTFPDNYFFCGSRTQQYVQVGNAVPPLLAYQIAGVVHTVLTESQKA